MFDKATFVVDREQIVLQLQTFFSACKVRRSFEIAKVPVRSCSVSTACCASASSLRISVNIYSSIIKLNPKGMS